MRKRQRHCSLIPKRCNAIQTLLQLNSNNSTLVRFRIILQSPDFAGYRRISPEITQNVAISRPKSPDKNPAICAELICSAWLSGDRNLLKSQQGF